MRARSNPRWRSGSCRIAVAGACDLSLDLANNLFRLGISSVNHQPARTFWNPSAKENYNETQRGADPERAAPSQPDWQPARIKQHEGRGRPKCSANQGGRPAGKNKQGGRAPPSGAAKPVRAVNY